MGDQPRHLRGTRIGIPDQVSPGWEGYTRAEVDRHAEEVHYDVLRDSGFDKARARQIARESSERQSRLVDEHRVELGQAADPSTTPVRPTAPRFITPQFGPYAGRLCVRQADGTLEPSDDPGEPTDPPDGTESP